METRTVTGLIAFTALVFSVIGFTVRLLAIRRLPFAKDLSVPKDSAARGILYAFTTGMMPWAKESTRLHVIAYVRGILFHIGIFVGLAVLVLSPWLEGFDSGLLIVAAVVTGLGALMGIVGGIVRIADRNLRLISTPDDHASVWLVSFFLISITLSLLSTSYTPVAYVVAAVMLVYAPASKIRHCIYFYFGRLFYGLHIGRRGIVRGLEASHG